MIEIIQADITTVKADAIVNAANATLMGGGGVDGAIHRAGGSAILEECKQVSSRQGGCKTGEAVITTAGNLQAKFVIHTVGPVWHDGDNNEDTLLAKCYENSLAIAAQHKIKTIAFPSISTGVYRFPLYKAAEIAIDTVSKSLTRYPSIEKVYFVCFDHLNYEIYKSMFHEHSDA
jgi:O-acetyl-ADP-ribose deacetylase (regulator of RNase III)